MSLARAFTTRKAKNPEMGSSIPKRGNTLHKSPSQRVMRTQISGPMELVHTTNMLSYNAPDLPSRRPSESGSTSTRPEDDSDAAMSTFSTPPTSPETDSEETCRPLPNHLSSYFMAPSNAMTITEELPPAIPKRSPSHTKKSSYDLVARKRSVSRMSEQSVSTKGSMSFSRTSSVSTRASTVSHASSPHVKESAPPMPAPAQGFDLPIQGLPVRKDSLRKKQRDPQSELPIQHPPTKAGASPFGNELAQVTELAEEFGAHCRMDVIYEDEQYLMTHGLARMTPDDYLNDIHSLVATFFPEAEPSHPEAALWI